MDGNKVIAESVDNVPLSEKQHKEQHVVKQDTTMIKIYEDQIKALQEQLVHTKQNLRDVLYNVLPTLAFNNVPLYNEKAPATQNFALEVGKSPLDYVRGESRTDGKFELFEVIPESESPDHAVIFRGAIQIEGDKPCLVKEIALNNRLDAQFVESLHNEIGILHGLRHDCIARIIHVERYPRIIHIFYDIDVGMMKLKDAITKVSHYNDIFYIARTFRCIMSAIIFCHDKRYAHLDICPSNILIRPQNCSAILTGFESCRLLNPNTMKAEKTKVHRKYNTSSNNARNNKTNRYRSNKSNWSSPEVFFNVGDNICASSDVFSAAVVLLDILYHKYAGFPYPKPQDENGNDKRDNINNGRSVNQHLSNVACRKVLPSGWSYSAQSKLKLLVAGISQLKPAPLGSEALKDMLVKMLTLNSGDRISARDVIKDVWIRGIMIAVQNVNKHRALRTTFRRNDNSPPPSLPHNHNLHHLGRRISGFGEVAANDRTWNALHLPPLDRFVRASNYVHQHRTLFSAEEALEFYGLWMQSTEGPASRFGTPFKNDYRERRKWDAWRSHKMKPQISAMLEYVAYLNTTIDSRINENISQSNAVSVNAAHLGLSIAKAKPTVREFETASLYDNHHSQLKMQQQRSRLGSFTPGIRQQRPSTAGKSRLAGSPISKSKEKIKNKDKYDNEALEALQQTRPNTAPVADSGENKNGYVSPSNLIENRKKAFRQYEFLNNLSPSRLYTHQSTQMQPTLKNTNEQKYEKYSLKKHAFDVPSSSPIRMSHSKHSSVGHAVGFDNSNSKNVCYKDYPAAVKINEKTFHDSNNDEISIIGIGKQSRGRSNGRKNRNAGGSNSQKVFPNIDGLAQEINNGELSGW